MKAAVISVIKTPQVNTTANKAIGFACRVGLAGRCNVTYKSEAVSRQTGFRFTIDLLIAVQFMFGGE